MGKFLVALVLGISGSLVHAQTADQSVNATVKNLVSIVGIGNQSQRVAQLCQLVKNSVDLPVIAGELLGSNFGTMERDAAGIKNFNALMPSIIVSEFYSLVSDKAGAQFTTDTRLVPKGSQRVGVNVNIGGTPLTITVLKKNLKIVDAEFSTISLVKIKREEYQRELQRFWDTDNFNSKPVTMLVQYLINSGKLIRCP